MIGQSSGQEVPFLTPTLSQPTELSHAFLLGAGWVINAAFPEWIIRKRSAFNRVGNEGPDQPRSPARGPALSASLI